MRVALNPKHSIIWTRTNFRQSTANLKKPLRHNRRNSVRQWIKMKLNKVDEKVFKTLKEEGKELTLQELTDKTGEPCKKVFKSLKKFFELEIIETKARKYKLTGKDPAAKEDPKSASEE
jgi:uncharacterized membrane protein